MFVTIAVAVAFCAAIPSARAQATYFWNGANASASPAGGGTGTWDTTAANWRQASDTGSAVSWPGTSSLADAAVFAGTSGTVMLSGSLAANALSFTVGGYTLTGGTLGLNGTAPSLSVTTGTATISSLLTVTGGVKKTGAGTLVLSASNGAGFTGGATISAGVLQLNSAFAVGSNNITLGDANTGSSNVQLTLSSAAAISSFANGIAVSNQGTGVVTVKFVGSSSNSGGGTMTLNRATTLDATDVTGINYTFNQSLSGTGNITLTNSNGVRFLVNRNSSGYTGNITVQSGGIWEPRDRLSAGTGNNITIDAGGELRIQLALTSIGGLFGSGTVQSVSGTGTLSVGKANASGTFSGILRDNPTVLSFTKTGSGTQTLSGANTYTGTTTISGGVLRIGDSGTTGSLSTSSAITGSAGATLAFNRSNTLTQGDNFNNVIGGAINVSQIGTGTLMLSASNTYSGTTTAAAGTIVATGTGSLPGFSTTGLVVINGGTLAVRTGGSGWTMGQVDSLLSAATKSAGTLGIDTTNGDITQGTAFTNTNLGPLGLAKLGTNALTLSAPNTYTGPTTVSSGTLVVGDGATAGSIGSTSGVSVASGATLAFNRTDNYDGNFTPAISGAGAVELLRGKLALTGNNSYGGATRIAGGWLAIGSTGQINGTSGVIINGVNAELKYNSATALTQPITFLQGTLSGTGTINTLVTVGSGATHSPGNSPGIQTVANETWDTGGTYLWEINDWNGTAGDVNNGFDQIAVTGTLNVNATTGSKFTIAITGLTGSNAAGVVPNFNNAARKTFTIATSGSLTNFAANKFTLDSSSFSGSNSLNNGGFTIGSSDNDVVLTYIPSAVYTLSANATATAIRVGGTSTITATLTSSTTAVTNPDSLAYTGLSLPNGLGTVSASGTLAGGASASGSAAFTTLEAGSYTFTPSITSGSNATINTSANAGTTLSANVTVYNPASANSFSGTTVALTNVHVGQSFGTQLISIWNTGTAAGAFQEGLAGSYTSATGAATGSGAFTNLFTGSASSAISVGLGDASTATAGVKSGTVTLGFTSTGTTSSGATGLSPLTISSQTVAVTGTVFNYAAANSISGTINLGTVLKGTSLSQTLSITNTAPSDGFSEKLDATFGPLAGGVTTNAGSIGLLAAGGTSTAMSVYLASGSAGTALGSAQVNFTSNGEGTSGLGTTSLSSQTVSLTATVLDPAVASFMSGTAALTTLSLNFGSVNQGDTVSAKNFSLYNLLQTAGYTADLALVDIISGTGNTNALSTNLSQFNSLASGSFNSWQAFVNTANQGSFSNTWTLQFKSANGGNVYNADTPQTLTLTANVIVVPEPGAFVLAGFGIGLAAWARWKRRRTNNR